MAIVRVHAEVGSRCAIYSYTCTRTRTYMVRGREWPRPLCGIHPVPNKTLDLILDKVCLCMCACACMFADQQGQVTAAWHRLCNALAPRSRKQSQDDLVDVEPTVRHGTRCNQDVSTDLHFPSERCKVPGSLQLSPASSVEPAGQDYPRAPTSGHQSCHVTGRQRHSRCCNRNLLKDIACWKSLRVLRWCHISIAMNVSQPAAMI